MNYFDIYGFHTLEVTSGRFTETPLPDVALQPGYQWNWTGVKWVQLIPYDPATMAPPPSSIYTKLSKRAFQDRFPLTSNGISRKYDRLDLFLRDDGYAASLGVTGSAMYELRLMITTGINRLSASTHVDFAMPDAGNFLLLLTSPSIPEAFRLTTAERTKMLNEPILDNEKYTGV